MPSILADGVCVDFPVAAESARSIRNVAFRRSARVGARMVEDAASVRIVRALSNVSFRLSEGDRMALVGHNGAGKTTLIRALAGIYQPSSGRLRVHGSPLPMFDINLGFDEEATGYDNIYLRGLVMGLNRSEIALKVQAIADYSELGSFLDMPLRTYSQGMMLRLMFAIATSIEGDIVLMDEWITAGDADFQRKANARLREITARTGILVLASHNMGLVRQVCNLALHLEGGSVRNFGPINDVLRQMSADAGPESAPPLASDAGSEWPSGRDCSENAVPDASRVR